MKHLSIRRVISFLLIFAMLLPMLEGLGPITFAQSTAEPIILIAGSDYQQGWYDADEEGVEEWGEQSGSEFVSILNTMASAENGKYVGDVDGMLFGGDYSRWFMSETDPAGADDSYEELLKLKAHLADSNLMASDADYFYIQGNHEDKALDSGHAIFDELAPSYGQADDADGSRGYGVFVMHEDLFPWQQKNAGSEEIVRNTANELKAYLAETKAAYGDDYPIFVLAHVPLHYSSRTYTAGDNLYADYIVDVLNEAGSNGQTIIYLYGHNHSSGYDEYLGGATNYIPRGDSLWVANPNGQTMYPTERTLSFTYMNAGFLGYYDTENANIDSDLTMSMFIIENGQITVKRFDSEGEHDVKKTDGSWCESLEGRLHDWQYGYERNLNVYEGAQTIDINELELELPLILRGEQLFHVGEYATVSVKDPTAGATYSWSVSDSNVVSLQTLNNGQVTLNGKTTGTATVQVTESGTGKTATFTVDVRGANETVVLPAKTTDTIFSFTTSFRDGRVYMIANSRTLGDSDAKVLVQPTDAASTKSTQGSQVIYGYPGGNPYIVQNGDYSNLELFVFEQSPDHPTGTGWLRSYGSNWNHGTSDAPLWWFHYLSAGTDWYTWVSDKKNAGDVPGDQNFTVRSGLWAFSADGDCIYNVLDGAQTWWLFHGVEGTSWEKYQFGLTNYWDSSAARCTYIYEKNYLDITTSFSGKNGSVVGTTAGSAQIGVNLILTRKDSRTDYVPVTLDMITGWPEGVSVSSDGVITGLTDGTYTGLGVKYDDTVLCGDLTLTVSASQPTNVKELEDGSYYYRLTDTFVDGKDYIIVNRNTVGTAQVVAYNSTAADRLTKAEATVYLDADGVPCVRIGDSFSDANAKFTFLEQANKSTGGANFGYLQAASGYYLESSSDTWTYTQETATWDADTDTGSTGTGAYMTYYGECFGYWPNEGGLSAYRTKDGGSGWRSVYYNTTDNTFHAMYTSENDGTCQVYIYERAEITQQTYEPLGLTGTVVKQTTGDPGTGSFIKITRQDGSVSYREVTVSMLDLPEGALNDECRITGLTVTYDGVVVTNNYTLMVTSGETVAPEYPNQGAVRVDKKLDTSENTYFETGVARIDLSVTGIPMQQGVDLLLVVDTSSSMTERADDTGISRIQALRNAVGELITQLKVPNEDGTLPDIELGIVQFNDHTYFDTDDHLYGSKVFNYFSDDDRSGIVQEFGNINTLSFDPEVITTKSGTNYDVGLQYAYNYLSEKKAANLAKGDDRKQVVVFMSDGLCYQYNWLSNATTSEGSAAWETWLTGTSDEVMCNDTQTYLQELEERRGVAYAELFHTEGRNWIAEAIKGEAPADGVTAPTAKVWDTDQDMIDGYYKVVFRDERVNPNTYDEPPVSLADSWQWVPGLGATVYTIGFGLSDENSITVETGRDVLRMIATDPSMYTDAGDSAALHQAFRSIGQSLRTAGEAAYMRDQMGVDFDLQMADVINDQGAATGFKPTIKVSTYDLYKFGEIGEVINGVTVTESMVGTRKSAAPSAVLETVTFNADGTEAYSDQLTGNILSSGVICAKTFRYNTTGSDALIDLDGDGTAEYTLPAETFYWNVGNITEQELVLSYYVYLTGSTGENADREAGNYPTNSYATLTYTDFYGNEQTKPTVSPILPWKQAQVSYGYYLVDGSGNVVVNSVSGATGSFANKIALGKLSTTSMTLNDEDGITITASKLKNLPSGYVLFDTQAAYNVHAHSGGGGGWTVTQEDQLPATTYVAGYGGNPTVELTSQNAEGYDYSHTIVWFAVMVADDTMMVDKTVGAVEGKDDEFTLTLDAYATGSTVELASTKPSDIVLVLDQSSTMYTPAGVNADRIYAKQADYPTTAAYDSAQAELAAMKQNGTAFTGSQFYTKVQDALAEQAANGTSQFLEDAKHQGYWIAIHDKYEYMYIVQYAKDADGDWGWYYVCVDQTTRSVKVDTENVTTSSDTALSQKYGTVIYGECELLTNVTYYKSQYGALYDTLRTFVRNLHAESVRTGVNHRVAVVGFSSPFYDGWNNYDGTGVYIDGQYYLYDTDYKYTFNDVVYDPDLSHANGDPVYNTSTAMGQTEKDKYNGFGAAGRYDEALVSVLDQDGCDSILKSVDAYTANYQQTCPSIGILLAETIFDARTNSEATINSGTSVANKSFTGSASTGYSYNADVDSEHKSSTYTADNAQDRDEIIVLFTDGVPTVRCCSDRDLGFSEDKCVSGEFWDITAGVDDAIDHAHEAKEKGIRIYTVGTSRNVLNMNLPTTSAEGDSENAPLFLDYVSSDYPDATSSLSVTPIVDTAKDEVTGATVVTTVNTGVADDQGYASYASDEGISVSFDTIYNSIVATVPLDNTAVMKELLSDYFELSNLTEDELLSNITVYTSDYLGTDENGKHLFSEELVPFPDAKVEVSQSKGDGRYDVITVTNFNYQQEYVGMEDDQPRGRKLVVKVNVKARDGFWGGNNVPTNDEDTAIYTQDGEPVIYFPMPEANVPLKPALVANDKTVYYGGDVTSKELLSSVTVDGVSVNVSDTGVLTPQQDWMDDFATLTWSEGSTVPGQSAISGRDAEVYPYSVTLTSRYDGSENRSDNPSNMAGDIVTSETASDDANVYVLEPVITWKDVTINLGDTVGESFYKDNDFVSLEWVDQDTRTAPTELPENPPTLDYTYSYSGQPLEDTPVDVRVTSSYGNEDITHVVTYLWQDCDNSVHKINRDQIFEHKGGEASREFYIHVVGGDALVSNKTVDTVEGTTDRFELTMEGYVTGSISELTITKPADIVLVLDHSGSMHTPVGATEVLYSPDTETGRDGQLYTGSGQLTKADLDPVKGAHRGYYVAQSTSSLWWFMLEYDAANQKWIGYSIPSTESIVDTTAGNYTEHTLTQSWSYNELPSQLVYYKTQYGVLYDSVISFVEDLRASGVEHAVSIVGFAGAQTTGTRIYVGGDEDTVKTYRALYADTTTEARRVELFRKAMKNVQDDGQYAELLSNIEAIETNSSFTCPSAGIRLANALYDANELDRNGRDRIMILFTDGIPNRGMADDNTTDLTQTEIYDEIVKEAAKAKQTYGTTLYSVSTTTLGTNADRTFLSYASSDYPNATGYATPGEPIDVPHYTLQVNGIDDMGIVFDTVTQAVAGTKVQLDNTAILQDTLSDYFQLAGTEQDITVYSQAYLGNNTWDDPVEVTGTHITVSTSSTEGVGGRTDVIEVTGFNYSQEYISEESRTQTVTRPNGETATVENYYGSKLVVKVKVKARDGFWGGNNVPTNENTAGIYGGGELLDKFPEPQAYVPVKPVISAKDQVVYYGEDGLDALDHLVGNITVGGEEVTYDEETGKFVPGADWMDDFADLSWDPDYLNPADPDTTVSGTKSDDYTFGVVLTPKTDGTNNTTEGDDNIAGEPVGSAGVSSDPATGSVDVLVPVITFEDSTIALGDETDKTYYEATNRKETISWVNQDDPYGTEGLPTDATEGFTDVPELSFSYSTEGTFTQDTPINVEVHLGTTPTEDNKITSEVYFDWVDCGSDLHDDDETVADDVAGDTTHRHSGITDSNEFYIHVTYILNEDMVVIDFGLKVDIDALMNDELPEGTSINSIAIAEQIPALYTDALDTDAYGSSQTADHGKLEIITNDQGKTLLRYTPSDMEMNVKEVFIYAVAKGSGEDVRYYYAPVTVIPATTIYYEDNFVDYSVSVSDGNGGYTTTPGGWSDAGDPVDGTQAEDRPGNALDSLDANNIYGYDSAYTDMTTYSNGSAKWVTVQNGKYAEATFTFWGTGFDVISLTDADSGTILVTVEDLVNGTETNYMVDTYYGYKYDATNKEWVVDSEDSDTLYQVPVMKVDMETYSHYKVTVNVSWAFWLDHGQNGGNGSYNFYLDAIRIYDPAARNTDGSIADEVIEGAYNADYEANPTYEELRNMLITANDFDSLGDTEIKAGAIFIDGNTGLSEDGSYDSVQETNKSYAVSEYMNYGPNNELYLAPDQAVTFTLGSVGTNGRVHIALKSVGDFGGNNDEGIADGSGSATVEIFGLDANKNRTDVTVGDNGVIGTATDLYYDITALAGKTVVIRNAGTAGIVSVTNLKTTDTPAALMMFSISRTSTALALAALNEGEAAPIEPAEGTVSLKYATASFEDEVKLNIYFDTDLAVQPEDMGLITFSNEVTDGTLDNAEAVISGAAAQADGSYSVSTNGIAAKNLGDEVWFRVYARQADGSVVYSKLVSYSPKTYAMSILSGSFSAEMKALVVAMLNYGAAAQTYFGHNTDALVNGDLTAEQLALVEAYSDDMTAPVVDADAAKVGSFVSNGGFSKKYPTVSFEGAFAINYYFTPDRTPAGDMTLYYWSGDAYEAAELLTADNATGVLTMTDGMAQVSGIAAKDLDSTVYVAVVYESEGVRYCSGVLAYSIGAYCDTQAASGNSLAAAAAVYGSYAKVYFG